MITARVCSTSYTFCSLAIFFIAAQPQRVLAQGVTPTIATDRSSRSYSLQDVLNTVAIRFPTILAARARVESARGDRQSAGAFENPQLSYQVENTPFPGSQPLNGVDREAMTTAMIPLGPLYQRGPRVQQANALLRVAEADVVTVRQRTLLAAARAYYRTATATVMSEAADNVTLWLDSVVTYNRIRVQQGVAAEADLLRSELERDRAAADAAVSAAELARARSDLSTFLSDSPVLSAVRSVALLDVALSVPVGVVAITSRSELTAAREQLDAANAAISIESRNRLRELAATVGIKQTGGRNSMVAGFTLPLPLFDQNSGRVNRARAERDISALELELIRRSASADLAGSDSAARVLTERVSRLTTRDATGTRAAFLSRADESRAIALGAYREGAATLLQVLDAARSWSDSRITFYRTVFAQHDAVLALLVARGSDIVASLSAVLPAPPTPPSR